METPEAVATVEPAQPEAPKRKPVRRPDSKVLISVKVKPELLAAMRERARAEGTSVTALLERGVGQVLSRPVSEKAAQTAQAALGQGIDEPARVSPKAKTDAPKAAYKAPPTDDCGRCGHPRRAHWKRGCFAGCNCGESLYRRQA